MHDMMKQPRRALPKPNPLLRIEEGLGIEPQYYRARRTRARLPECLIMSSSAQQAGRFECGRVDFDRGERASFSLK
jgi:hypothetical protein